MGFLRGRQDKMDKKWFATFSRLENATKTIDFFGLKISVLESCTYIKALSILYYRIDRFIDVWVKSLFSVETTLS